MRSEQGDLVEENAWDGQGDLLLEHRETGVIFRALGRQLSRPQSGAEYRFRLDETSDATRSDLAFILSQPAKANYRWSLGLALAESTDSRSGALPPRDLANEWTQMQRRHATGSQSGLSITSSFVWDHEVFGRPAQLALDFGERFWRQIFEIDDSVLDPVVWDDGGSVQAISFATLDNGKQEVRGEQGYLSVQETWDLDDENQRFHFLAGAIGQWTQSRTTLAWYALRPSTWRKLCQ